MVTRYSIVIIGLLSMLGVFFVTTRPDGVPAAALMAVFAALYILSFVIVALALVVLRQLGVHAWKQAKVRRTSAAVAALPVMLLVLQSIGQLTVRDVLLSGGLFVLLHFYFSRLNVAGT